MSEEERAREVLASVDRMPPTTSRTIFYPEETVVKAMIVFASPLETAARTLIAKLDECAPHVSDAFLHRGLRCGPYEGPNYAAELAALRDLLSPKQEADHGG